MEKSILTPLKIMLSRFLVIFFLSSVFPSINAKTFEKERINPQTGFNLYSGSFRAIAAWKDVNQKPDVTDLIETCSRTRVLERVKIVLAECNTKEEQITVLAKMKSHPILVNGMEDVEIKGMSSEISEGNNSLSEGEGKEGIEVSELHQSDVRGSEFESGSSESLPHQSRLLQTPAIQRVLQSPPVNDPLYPKQTDLTKLGANMAWSVYNADNEAQNAGPMFITVAILDSGVDLSHPEFGLTGTETGSGGSGSGGSGSSSSSVLFRNNKEIADNGIDDDGNGFIDDVHGVDFVNDDGDPDDDAGHGTGVAGVVASIGNNNYGTASLAGGVTNPRVKILPIKILDENLNGKFSDYLLGMDYALVHGAQISLNAWGARIAGQNGVNARNLLKKVFTAAGESGHLVIGAAGNDGLDLDKVQDYIPCIGGSDSDAPDNLLCVTSFNRESSPSFPLSKFSNYGKNTVHVAFPGEEVITPVPIELQRKTAGWGVYGSYSSYGNGVLPHGLGFTEMTGTSVAAAHAASLSALLWSFRPPPTGLTIGTEKTAKKLITFLKDQATDKDTVNIGDKISSGGRANAQLSLGMANAALGQSPSGGVRLSPTSITTTVGLVEFIPDPNGVAAGVTTGVADGAIFGKFRCGLVQSGNFATDASEIRFYFLNGDDEVLSEVALKEDNSPCLVPSGTSVECELPTNSGSGIAFGSLKIGAYPVLTNSDGEMVVAVAKGNSVVIPNSVPVPNSSIAIKSGSLKILIPDDNKQANVARVRIGFSGITDETDLIEYRIYQLSIADNGRITKAVPSGGNPSNIPPLAVVPKRGFVDLPPIIGTSQGMEIERYGGNKLEIRSWKGWSAKSPAAADDYLNDKHVYTKLRGPGTLKVDYVDVEENYDFVKIGSTVITGNYLATSSLSSRVIAPIKIEEGRDLTVLFHSDGSGVGGGFCLTFVQELDYEVDVVMSGVAVGLPANDDLVVVPVGIGGTNAAPNEGSISIAPRIKVIDNASGDGIPPTDDVDVLPYHVSLDDVDMALGKVKGELKIYSSQARANSGQANARIVYKVDLIKVEKTGNNGNNGAETIGVVKELLSIGDTNVLIEQDTPETGIQLLSKQCEFDVQTSSSLSSGSEYRIRIIPATVQNGYDARSNGLQIPVIDVGSNSDSKALITSSGLSRDLNPQTRVLSGSVSIVPANVNMVGLTGYRAYWSFSADGITPQKLLTNGNINTTVAALELKLSKTCPPTPGNGDFITSSSSIIGESRHGVQNHFSLLPCTLGSPYAPICAGTNNQGGNSCSSINIQTGENGDFFISTSSMDDDNTNSKYSNNAYAELYFAYGGEIEYFVHRC